MFIRGYLITVSLTFTAGLSTTSVPASSLPKSTSRQAVAMTTGTTHIEQTTPPRTTTRPTVKTTSSTTLTTLPSRPPWRPSPSHTTGEQPSTTAFSTTFSARLADTTTQTTLNSKEPSSETSRLLSTRGQVTDGSRTDPTTRGTQSLNNTLLPTEGDTGIPDTTAPGGQTVENEPSFWGMAGGVPAGFVILLAVVLFAVYITRRRNEQRPEHFYVNASSQSASASLDDDIKLGRSKQIAIPDPRPKDAKTTTDSTVSKGGVSPNSPRGHPLTTGFVNSPYAYNGVTIGQNGHVVSLSGSATKVNLVGDNSPLEIGNSPSGRVAPAAKATKGRRERGTGPAGTDKLPRVKTPTGQESPQTRQQGVGSRVRTDRTQGDYLLTGKTKSPEAYDVVSLSVMKPNVPHSKSNTPRTKTCTEPGSRQTEGDTTPGSVDISASSSGDYEPLRGRATRDRAGAYSQVTTSQYGSQTRVGQDNTAGTHSLVQLNFMPR